MSRSTGEGLGTGATSITFVSGVGSMVGYCVGLSVVGTSPVIGEGFKDNEGDKEEETEGNWVGTSVVGISVGNGEVGLALGLAEGLDDGASLGYGLGSAVGERLGLDVGFIVGESVGYRVGSRLIVGLSVVGTGVVGLGVGPREGL